MKARATFPIYLSGSRSFEDNLVSSSSVTEHLVCKAPDGVNTLALRPSDCSYDDEECCTICEDSVDEGKCTACLCCQIGIAQPYDGVNRVGIPAESPYFKYDQLSKLYFNGEYIAYPIGEPAACSVIRRYNEYTGKMDERNFTNPMIGCYLWSLSGGAAFVSCSPAAELSLPLSETKGEREGHLDVTMRSYYYRKRYLFVAECKRNIRAFLTDTNRDQQRKYKDEICSIADKHGYEFLFSYIIGGNEEPLYPPSCHAVATAKFRNKFFHDILANKRRFISIHALRGLGVLYIASGGKICLENSVASIFQNTDIYGLVLGGVIFYDGRRFVLRSLRDFISTL